MTSSHEHDPYAAPVPRTFYIHDDISNEIREAHGQDSQAYQLTRSLFDLVHDRDPDRVTVLTVEEQIEALITRGGHSPFGLTIGIGRAGERVARQLNERVGWFPAIRRVDVTREEDGTGGYRVVSTTSESIASQLKNIEDTSSLAVVDDTVFSGITMRTLLESLPRAVLARTHAFCLRCVGETLPSIRALCPISPGFTAEGRILDEASFINASGLVTRVGIRRSGKPSMAFFERLDWMRAWFPGYSDEVISLARELNSLLESDNDGNRPIS